MKLTFWLFLALLTRSFAADFAVPPEGNVLGGNAAPFLYTSMRYQQVYGATAFSSLTPVGGGWITAIQFRQVTGSYIDGFAELEMRLSTTSRAVDGLSTTFSENIGNDEQVIVPRTFGNLQGGGDGPLGLAAGPYVVLSIPFFYNPAAGNLLLDVTMFRGPIQFDPVGFDESDRSTDQSSRVFAFDRAALTGRADTDALITGFRITPIPEPGPAALLISALAVASMFGIRKKRAERTK